ncbi:MAG: hypothetical protein JW940_20575 [Polyangiaceae bacterium]|nr:hypothetical protein [Polyangiaceae bacterium]
MTRLGRVPFSAFWTLLILVSGCRRDDPFAIKPHKPYDDTRAAAPAPTPAVPAPAPTRPAKRPENPVQRLVMAWNAALDSQDVNQLVPLYGPRILFYGVKRNSEQVLETKRRQLKRSPDYRQRIDNVRIARSPNGYVVEFDKWSGPKAGSRVRARLVLETIAGRLFIAEESDAVTDRRLRKPPRNTCADAALSAAAGVSAIMREQERVAAEMPGVSPGGIVYQADDSNVEAGSGFFHAERFEARWWIDVVAGEITVRDALTGDILPVAEEERERVRQTCSGADRTDAGGG